MKFFVFLLVALFIAVEASAKRLPMSESERSLSSHKSKKEAQRAFLIFWIRNRGILLMEAWKKKKGSHYQLPGGRIDTIDFETANVTDPITDLRLDQYVAVGRQAVIREVMEETSIDLSDHRTRLIYLPSVTEHVALSNGKKGFVKETVLPRKLYFYLEVMPEEFHASKITLSPEHIAFNIQADVKSAIKQIDAHSGGDSARALRRFNEDLTLLVTH